jgi:hypothetical protein
MSVSHPPEVKKRPVCELGEIAPGNRGENILQPVPLPDLIDFPAVQIQMSNATLKIIIHHRLWESSLITSVGPAWGS